MSSLIIFVAVLIALFLVVFITKRRFGVLGLALVAGAYCSTLWAADVTPFVEGLGVTLTQPPLRSVVAMALILLPATLLLVSGPTYHTVVRRSIGAAVFAVMALALLLEPLGSALIIDGAGKTMYDVIGQWRMMIVATGLLIAVGDLLMTKTPKMPAKH